MAYSVKTIRYYADLGLLYSTIQRNSVGYRLFTEGVFSRLNFIKRSQNYLFLELRSI